MLVFQPEDWYRVKSSQIKKHGGGALARHYPSLAECLKAVYPEVPWQVDRFRKSTRRRGSLLAELDRAERILGISKVIFT